MSERRAGGVMAEPQMVNKVSKPGSTQRPTLADVAREAGVSSATASKALSGRYGVKNTTRLAVQQAADRLKFTPNRGAQALAIGRTGTVGMVTHDLEGRFSIPVLLGAEDTFGTNKVSIFLCDARGDSIREEHHVSSLLGRQVDGLIVVGARPDPRPSLGNLSVPVVYAYAPSQDPQDMSVIVDQQGAGAIAVEHLLDCGKKKIAIIAGDRTYGAASERVQGAQEALAAAGMAPVIEPLFGAWDEQWGRGAIKIVMDRVGKQGVDAVICGSDHIARGCTDTLRELGIDVPSEIAVIGYDNWEVMTEGSRPHLTSIDSNLEKVGQRAATRLMDATLGRAKPGLEVVSCQLVVRGTTVE